MSAVTTLGGLTIEHDPTNERPASDVGQLRAPIAVMPTTAFTSSNVHSALYDLGDAELFLRFLRDGPDAIYRYTGVPRDVWTGLKQADSKGRYVNDNIAFSFTYERLTTSNFPDQGRGLEHDLARRFVTDP